MGERAYTMKRAQYWQRIDHTDPRALAIADRHYSRKSPGTIEFIPAGHKIVLMSFLPDTTPAALWASHRPAPTAGLARPRFDGLDVWDCSLFRIEHRTVLASVLIQEAVAITRGLWDDILPRDGFYTTVNPRHIQPIKVHGRDVWGYCYIKAGWQALPERTKVRHLIQLQLPLSNLEAIEPLAVAVGMPPFGIAWRHKKREIDNSQLALDL
jgi:hypothetical protein